MFDAHTVETAPEAARPTMQAVAAKWGGKVPDAVARMATSPELLGGFLSLSGAFENCTLDPLSRETVIMTVATRNECHICISIHTATLRKHGADAELIAALRDEQAVPDERLAAIQAFTLTALDTAGAVPDDDIKALLAHGYTERNALEVVLGIGAYTMSTFANRLIRAT
ncbi:carboxymuconolactone decarboxylase family protein [Streptomyces boninensis]|uniref:carboxymuconolactone decarboxylase family protein n=1 Tax=Streptomyces boninensis TaxID=2039455 RepID=UPI003B215560